MAEEPTSHNSQGAAEREAATSSSSCTESDCVLRVPITMGRKDKHSKTALLDALPGLVEFAAARLARGDRVVLCCQVRPVIEREGGWIATATQTLYCDMLHQTHFHTAALASVTTGA